MKKILVVCQYYYPENFQITPICEQLVEDGYEVTVLTGLPNYPLGTVPDEYRHGKHRDEYINGVRVIRCFEIGRKKGVVHLALNYLSFCLSSLMKVGSLDKDYDLVFIYLLSPILMGLPGISYAKKHNVPIFLYNCDLWPESMKMYIKNEENIGFRLIKRISKYVYTQSDVVAGQSTSFLPYLKVVHGISDDKLVYLPAFADEKYLEIDFTPENDIVDFVFLGNMGKAQNLGAVVSAIELIKDVPGFMVHFVGDGSCMEEIKGLVRDKGLEEIVCFYGRRPVEEMPKFYKLADACLVSLKADNQTGYTLPSKVQGYMAAGKPIIGMIDGAAKAVIDESRCGICVPSDDVEGLANAMRSFVETPDRYSHCGESGRLFFKQNFRKAIFMEKLENLIDEIGEHKYVTF